MMSTHAFFRPRLTCLLPAALLGLSGCDPSAETPPSRRQVPIEAPDPSAEGPARCPDAQLDDAWTYAWEGDRLVAAERLRPAVEGGRAALQDQDALAWDAEGRLVSWIRTGTEPITLRFERDAEGAITAWTRTVRSRAPLTVTASLVERGLRLRLEGELYVDLMPFDAEAFDVSALPDVAQALPSMALLTEVLIARHAGDQAGLEAALSQARVEEVRRFDEAGRLIETAFDLDGDGAPDALERRSYAEGEQTLSLDLDGDGVPERVVRTRLDAAGRPVTETVEGGLAVRFEYTDGLIKRFATPPGGVTQVTWLYHRPDGQRVLKYEDYDGDGRAEWRRRYWHTAAGQRSHAERDGDVDGIIEQREEHDYDAEGRRIATRILTPDPEGCGGRW